MLEVRKQLFLMHQPELCEGWGRHSWPHIVVSNRERNVAEYTEFTLYCFLLVDLLEDAMGTYKLKITKRP